MCSDFEIFPSSQEEIEQLSDWFRFTISNLHYFQNCSERQRFFLMYLTFASLSSGQSAPKQEYDMCFDLIFYLSFWLSVQRMCLDKPKSSLWNNCSGPYVNGSYFTSC